MLMLILNLGKWYHMMRQMQRLMLDWLKFNGLALNQLKSNQSIKIT
jgi:hypothetical protein